MTTAAKRLPRESRPADVRDAGAGVSMWRRSAVTFLSSGRGFTAGAGLPGQCSHVPEAAGGH